MNVRLGVPICVGDHVEFLSDYQTEKGPSAGTCVIVEGDRVAIKHSDCVEWFDRKALELERRSTHGRTGGDLWLLK